MTSLIHSINARYGTYRGYIRLALARLSAKTGRIDPYLHFEPASIQRLVFVCLGNINRSAYAEAYTRHRSHFPTCSIGLSTTTGAPATDLAIQKAADRFIDLTSHKATNMSDFEQQEGDLFLVMEIRHANILRERYGQDARILLLGSLPKRRYVHIHDPHTLSSDYYTSCFNRIEESTRALLSVLDAQKETQQQASKEQLKDTSTTHA
ncbi:hypothetical protein Q4583_10925 [Neptunomonas phycophila]|uniref:arsenate reductase/protein-tyrosine-phosphatase family protein n=1 Tax=Neptunomonas phycophila TaxID=1572645 RepID=UPI0026E33272|nr:hypothetical protein [Neptunomonas phycophila]MDO6784626.1 hypothetical protein [Neptunomonas phycophila]